MKIELQVDSACRICLQENESEMISIFEKDLEDEIVIYEKIEICGGIKINNLQDFPTHICRKCHIFLNFAFKFHIMCRKSNNYLYEFGSKGLEDNDLEFENTEYLLDYNPLSEATDDDDSCWTNTNKVEELDNTIELIDNTNTVSQNDNKLSIKIEAQEAPKTLKRKVGRPAKRKTLDISADGAAIIRVKNAKQIERELKKNQSHICDVCGNVYPKKYALEAHMRKHRSERPFECEICQRTFTFNFQLARHIIKHSGARPYQCVYCQRSFTDQSTMKKHERLHRNERPYECDTCGKTFNYSNVLKVHKLMHTGEKPYICGICSKRFTRAHHLRAHLETLLHSRDPKAKILLQQIRPEEEVYEEDA